MQAQFQNSIGFYQNNQSRISKIKTVSDAIKYTSEISYAEKNELP